MCALFLDSNELSNEQRLQQSLDKLNNRLRGNGQGGIKQGSFGTTMNKVCIHTYHVVQNFDERKY